MRRRGSTGRGGSGIRPARGRRCGEASGFSTSIEVAFRRAGRPQPSPHPVCERPHGLCVGAARHSSVHRAAARPGPCPDRPAAASYAPPGTDFGCAGLSLTGVWQAEMACAYRQFGSAHKPHGQPPGSISSGGNFDLTPPPPPVGPDEQRTLGSYPASKPAGSGRTHQPRCRTPGRPPTAAPAAGRPAWRGRRLPAPGVRRDRHRSAGRRRGPGPGSRQRSRAGTGPSCPPFPVGPHRRAAEDDEAGRGAFLPPVDQAPDPLVGGEHGGG